MGQDFFEIADELEVEDKVLEEKRTSRSEPTEPPDPSDDGDDDDDSN